MRNYGTVKSTTKPEEMVIDEYSVWINSDIKEIAETTGDDTFTGYQYNMVQYDKNEYIKMMSEKNETLDSQITDTQLALCELYEEAVAK